MAYTRTTVSGGTTTFLIQGCSCSEILEALKSPTNIYGEALKIPNFSKKIFCHFEKHKSQTDFSGNFAMENSILYSLKAKNIH